MPRPTTGHALKVIATSGNVVFLFDLKKLAAGKPLCTATVFVDFTGHAIGALRRAVRADGAAAVALALTSESYAAPCRRNSSRMTRRIVFSSEAVLFSTYSRSAVFIVVW